MITTTVTVAKYTVTAGVLTYPVPFHIYEAGDVLVLWSVDGGEEHTLTLTQDYSVEIASTDDGGGTVVLVADRVPAGATLAVMSNVPETQELDLSHTAEIDSESLETQLDRQVQMIQQHSSELERCVKLSVTDTRTPEEVADELLEARDRAEAAAASAEENAAFTKEQADSVVAKADEAVAQIEAAVDKALEETEEQVERAKAEADRAAQAVILGTQANNLEASWTLDRDYEAGEVLTMPVSYFPGRSMLQMSYSGVQWYKDVHYQETGDEDTLSTSIITLIPLYEGTVVHAWSIASNVVRDVEAYEQAAQEAAEKAQEAADKAVEAVQSAVDEAVREATEEADRAAAEADRAEKAAQASELGSSAYNIDATWTLACPVAPGGEVILPVTYWPGRSMLYLSANRHDLFRGSDYVEVDGTGEDGRSDRVKSMCNLAEGTQMHAWVIASNVSRLVDEAEQSAAESAAAADQSAAAAAASAQAAADSADKALASESSALASQEDAAASAAKAEAEADRAAAIATIGNSVNLEMTWALDEDVPAGEVLQLPTGLVYFPGMAMIRLSHDGIAMYPGAQFDEITEDGRTTSDSVRVYLDLPAGTVMNCWLAANIGKATDEAITASEEAVTAANVAKDAAIEATEQADRADDAAIDAAKYRKDAMDAARCAASSIQGRCIAAIQDEELLARVPSGFFVLNPDLVLPGTIQHPLTPVDSFEEIPPMDGFFLCAPPFTDCPPSGDGPQDPEDPDNPDPDDPDRPVDPDNPDDPDQPVNPDDPDGSDEPSWTLPCGKRSTTI